MQGVSGRIQEQTGNVKSKTILDELSGQLTLRRLCWSMRRYRATITSTPAATVQKVLAKRSRWVLVLHHRELFSKTYCERFFTQMKRHEAQLHSSETPYQCRSPFDLFYTCRTVLLMIKTDFYQKL